MLLTLGGEGNHPDNRERDRDRDRSSIFECDTDTDSELEGRNNPESSLGIACPPVVLTKGGDSIFECDTDTDSDSDSDLEGEKS